SPCLRRTAPNVLTISCMMTSPGARTTVVSIRSSHTASAKTLVEVVFRSVERKGKVSRRSSREGRLRLADLSCRLEQHPHSIDADCNGVQSRLTSSALDMEVGQREGSSGGSEVRNGLQDDADNAVPNYFCCVSGPVWIQYPVLDLEETPGFA